MMPLMVTREIRSVPGTMMSRGPRRTAKAPIATVATATASARQKVSLRRIRRRSTIWSASSDMACLFDCDSGEAWDGGPHRVNRQQQRTAIVANEGVTSRQKSHIRGWEDYACGAVSPPPRTPGGAPSASPRTGSANGAEGLGVGGRHLLGAIRRYAVSA